MCQFFNVIQDSNTVSDKHQINISISRHIFLNTQDQYFKEIHQLKHELHDIPGT